MIAAIRKQLKLRIPQQPIVLGKIGLAYGIRGWIKVFSYTEKSVRIFDYQPWLIYKIGEWQLIELESWKQHNRDFIIKIQGIYDRNAASFLANCEIIVDSEKLPILKGNNYYWKDLMGCQVVTTRGYKLGQVIDMIETGSNDVMILKANPKDAFSMKERLVPFLYGRVIKKIDLAAQVIEAEWDPCF